MRQGSPVLLLHGIPGSGATWDGVVGHLSENRTIAPDLLGFGTAPPFSENGHAEEQARALLLRLDAERIDRVHLVGFDFGGPTAVMFYRLARERVLSLTLAATNVFTNTPIPLPLRVARIPLLGEAAFRILFGRTGLALMWAGACGDRVRFPYRKFAEALTSSMGVRSTRHIFLISLRDLAKYYGEVEATLPQIRVPVSVVWGDRDPFFPVEIGRRVADSIPDATFIVLAGCGHFIPGERDAELAAIITRNIARGEEIDQRSSKIANSR